MYDPTLPATVGLTLLVAILVLTLHLAAHIVG